MIYLRSLIYGFVYCDSTTRSLERLFYHYALSLCSYIIKEVFLHSSVIYEYDNWYIIFL